jgi:hypothetical protein
MMHVLVSFLLPTASEIRVTHHFPTLNWSSDHDSSSHGIYSSCVQLRRVAVAPWIPPNFSTPHQYEQLADESQSHITTSLNVGLLHIHTCNCNCNVHMTHASSLDLESLSINFTIPEIQIWIADHMHVLIQPSLSFHLYLLISIYISHTG